MRRTRGPARGARCGSAAEKSDWTCSPSRCSTRRARCAREKERAIQRALNGAKERSPAHSRTWSSSRSARSRSNPDPDSSASREDRPRRSTGAVASRMASETRPRPKRGFAPPTDADAPVDRAARGEPDARERLSRVEKRLAARVAVARRGEARAQIPRRQSGVDHDRRFRRVWRRTSARSSSARPERTPRRAAPRARHARGGADRVRRFPRP